MLDRWLPRYEFQTSIAGRAPARLRTGTPFGAGVLSQRNPALVAPRCVPGKHHPAGGGVRLWPLGLAAMGRGPALGVLEAQRSVATGSMAQVVSASSQASTESARDPDAGSPGTKSQSSSRGSGYRRAAIEGGTAGLSSAGQSSGQAPRGVRLG